MTQETMKYDPETIVQGLIDQAGRGSCKTCRWCGRFGPGQDTYVEGATHWCMVQAVLGINAIHFTAASLQSYPYPWTCDVGAWETDARGCDDEIYGCLAYQPGYDGTLADDLEYRKAARAHWLFMRQLSRAVNLAMDIQHDSLTKLTAALNAATESLPATLALLAEITAQTKPSAPADAEEGARRIRDHKGPCDQCGNVPPGGQTEFGIIDDDGQPRVFCNALCLGEWNVAHGLLPWGEVPALDAEGLRCQALTILSNTLELDDTDQNIILCNDLVRMLSPIFRAMHLAEAKGSDLNERGI